MRWTDRRRSTNIEDRRGLAPRRAAVGGGIGVLALALVVMLLGGNPLSMLGGLSGGGAASPSAPRPGEDRLAEFSAVVLADLEDVWAAEFRLLGRTYEPPVLVLYRDRVETPGGMADAAMGPFYMPADRKVYLDLSFFEDLARRFGAGGDFAQAYVIAHEVGHHVQHLLGISDRVHAAQQRAGEVEANRLSVRLELQADFLAGVFAHHAQRTKNVLEPGDIDEALGAAAAIGDDRLQKRARGYVVPDSFTHGTSAQRSAWFRLGYETGDFARGDTFDEDNFRRVTPR